MKEIKKVSLYMRVSTEDQKQRGTIESQAMLLSPWCQKQGWNIAAVFRDDGVSGTTPIEDRPEGSKLIKGVRAGEWDAVAMVHSDRLTRSEDVEEIGKIIGAFQKSDTYTASPHEGIEDSRSFTGRLMKLIKAVFSAEERTKIIQRQQAGRARAVKENRYASGCISYGVRWIDHIVEDGKQIPVKKWEAHPQEYETLKEIFRLFREGYGCDAISRILNGDLAKHPTKRAKRWVAASLWAMLMKSDFLFTGKMKHLDTGIKLFAEEEVLEARHYIKRRHRSIKKLAGKPTNFLLQGLAECGSCERHWRLSIMTTPKAYAYYYCRNCKKYIRADKLDRAIWTEVVENFTNPAKLQRAIIDEEFIPDCTKKEAQALIKTSKDTLEDIEGQKERLNDLYVRGKMKTIQYETFTLELEQKEQATEADLRRAENTLADTKLMSRSIEKATEALAKQVTYLRGLDGIYEAYSGVKDIDRWTLKKVVAEVQGILESSKEFALNTLEGKVVGLDDVRHLIFQQKRKILNQLLLAGGRIRATKGKIEITGSLSEDFYLFNPVTTRLI